MAPSPTTLTSLISSLFSSKAQPHITALTPGPPGHVLTLDAAGILSVWSLRSRCRVAAAEAGDATRVRCGPTGEEGEWAVALVHSTHVALLKLLLAGGQGSAAASLSAQTTRHVRELLPRTEAEGAAALDAGVSDIGVWTLLSDAHGAPCVVFTRGGLSGAPERVSLEESAHALLALRSDSEPGLFGGLGPADALWGAAKGPASGGDARAGAEAGDAKDAVVWAVRAAAGAGLDVVKVAREAARDVGGKDLGRGLEVPEADVEDVVAVLEEWSAAVEGAGAGGEEVRRADGLGGLGRARV